MRNKTNLNYTKKNDRAKKYFELCYTYKTGRMSIDFIHIRFIQTDNIYCLSGLHTVKYHDCLKKHVR